MAAELDRGPCARPGLAALPGRFLFALDDGRGTSRRRTRTVLAGADRLRWPVDTGLQVARHGGGCALDAAEAFLALRAADGGTAWRAADLAGAPARIGAALATSGRATSGRRASVQHGGFTALGAAAGPGPAARPGPVPRDDGGLALVVAPLLGELTAPQVRLLADACSSASGWAVVTPWRTVVLPDPCVPAAELAAAGLLVAPGPAADVSACTGRPGCAKALADVRADALAALSRLPGGRVHVSGCARRCGAPRAAHVDAVALAGAGTCRRRPPPGTAAVTRSYVRDGAEIYRRSFATIRAEADLAALPPDVAQVAVRMIHACGQVDLVDDLDFSHGVVTAARTALQNGAPILCDAEMVASGVTRARATTGSRSRCSPPRRPRVPALPLQSAAHDGPRPP
jgi:hypothetical protein